MTESFLLARPNGGVEKAGVCRQIRLSACAPFGFHVRWFHEDCDEGLTGSTGFCMPPRNTVRLEAALDGQLLVSLLRTSSGPRLRVCRLPGQAGPGGVSVQGRLMDGGGARALQHALAGAHPVDNLRRILPLSGSEDWRWLHQNCGLDASYLEDLQSALRELPVQIECLLWEAACDEKELRGLLQWVGSIVSWERRENAWEQIAQALAADPGFLRTPGFEMLEAAGALGPAWPFARAERVAPLRPLLRNPGHATLLLRLHTLARRSQSRLRGGIESQQWAPLAERALEAAPERLANSAARQIGLQALAEDGWLFDAQPPNAGEAKRAWESLMSGSNFTLREENGWRLFGPAAMQLQRRRTLRLRLPWLPVRQAYLLTKFSRLAKIQADGPSQLRVLHPYEGDLASWRHIGADVLSGPFSLSDGMARGGPDRLHWEHTYPLAPGPLPRFLGKLLRDYQFPALPPIAKPSELTISFSLRRECVEGCATAPSSRDPEYAEMVTRMTRTLQWAMRRWVPFVYFLENPEMYSSRVVMPVLIFAASMPRALKKRMEFGYEVVNKGHVLRAIRSGARKLPAIFHEFDPFHITLQNGYNSVFRSTSVNSALNYAWRFPRQLEQLLHFDLFLIEQSINLLESARRIRGSLHESKEKVARLFQIEVESMARTIRRRLHRDLPVDLDAYVPLLLIQAISAIGGKGLGVDIPAGAIALSTDGYTRYYRNRPATLTDESEFDGPAIPLKAA